MKTIPSRALLLTVLSVLAFNLPVPAFSQMMDMPMPGHGDGHGPKMEMGKMSPMMGMCLEHAEELGLSEDQVGKMKAIHRDLEKYQARNEADRKIAEIDLMEIMDAKDFNLEKATAAVKKSADIKTAGQVARLKAMKEMRTILTEDQFNAMKKMAMQMGGDKPERK